MKSENASNKTWLEVALNGPWTRRLQPMIPIEENRLIEEGIAAAEAGAAIIHLHAYDETTGKQSDDPDTYARIFEAIYARTDAIVYGTLPLKKPDGWTSRYDAVRALGQQGLLEWGVVDPGSINMTFIDAVGRDRSDGLYLNTDADIREGMQLAAKYRYVPSFACYEPGFIRLGAAMARRYSSAPPPVYRFMFSDEMTFGFPPEPWALEALVALVERETEGAPWMIAGLGVDVLPLIAPTIELGGHVRVGLEDAPLGTTLGNVDWVTLAADAIEDAGGELATADEIREEWKPAGDRD